MSSLLLLSPKISIANDKKSARNVIVSFFVIVGVSTAIYSGYNVYKNYDFSKKLELGGYNYECASSIIGLKDYLLSVAKFFNYNDSNKILVNLNNIHELYTIQLLNNQKG
mgnify:CR=1 FL=1